MGVPDREIIFSEGKIGRLPLLALGAQNIETTPHVVSAPDGGVAVTPDPGDSA
jgi:hypothetical protein